MQDIIATALLPALGMGYLFLGKSLQLYIEGEKKRSVAFFMKTVISFAAITAILLIVVSRVQR